MPLIRHYARPEGFEPPTNRVKPVAPSVELRAPYSLHSVRAEIVPLLASGGSALYRLAHRGCDLEGEPFQLCVLVLCAGPQDE